MPLTRAIIESHRIDVPIPGPLLGPLYALRSALTRGTFRYDLNVARFHLGGVLDGTRAREQLGYQPATSVTWPGPRWQTLVRRLRAAQAS